MSSLYNLLTHMEAWRDSETSSVAIPHSLNFMLVLIIVTILGIKRALLLILVLK